MGHTIEFVRGRINGSSKSCNRIARELKDRFAVKAGGKRPREKVDLALAAVERKFKDLVEFAVLVALDCQERTETRTPEQVVRILMRNESDKKSR